MDRPSKSVDSVYNINPFVCATLNDFDREKHLLHDKIAPQLRQLCKSRGVTFTLTDVCDDAAAAKEDEQLLVTCLDDITRSSPFFIALLGERYGTCRPSHATPLTAHADMKDSCTWWDKCLINAASSGHEWVMEFQDCSLLELQLIHATLRHQPMNPHVTFYFRQADHGEDLNQPISGRFLPESEYCQWRLQQVKIKVIEHGLMTSYYRTVEELATRILDQWTRIVDGLFPPLHILPLTLTSGNEQEGQGYTSSSSWCQRAFMKQHEQPFYQSEAIKNILEHMTSFATASFGKQHVHREDDSTVNDKLRYSALSLFKKQQHSEPSAGMLMLAGDRGSGKSSLTVTWVEEMTSQHPNTRLVTYFCESSAEHRTLTFLLQEVTIALRRLAGQQECEADDLVLDDDLALPDRLKQAFIAATALQSCVILLDGIDHVTACSYFNISQVKAMTWLPPVIPPNCRLIITTSLADQTYTSVAGRRDVSQVTVPSEFGSVHDVVEGVKVMASCHGGQRTLPFWQAAYIKKHAPPWAKTPVSVLLLATEMRIVPGADRGRLMLMTSYGYTLSLNSLLNTILTRWRARYRHTHVTDEREHSWLVDILRLISWSRDGLTYEALHVIMAMIGYADANQVMSYEWATFRTVTGLILYEAPGGYVRFKSQFVRELFYVALVVKDASLLKTIDDTPHIKSLMSPPKPSVSVLMTRTHSVMAQYFASLPLCVRHERDLVWHLQHIADRDTLTQRAINLETLKLLILGSVPGSCCVTSELCPQFNDVMHLLEIHGLDLVSRYAAIISHLTGSLAEDSIPQLLFVIKLLHALRQRGHVTTVLTLLIDLNRRVRTHVQDESCSLLLEYSISVTLDKIKDATAYKWYSKAYRTLAAISPSGVIDQKHLNTLSGRIFVAISRDSIDKGHMDKARDLLEQAVKCGRLAYDYATVVKALTYQAMATTGQSHVSDGERLLREAIEVAYKHCGRNHPVLTLTLEELATTIVKHGGDTKRKLEAVKLLRRALSLREDKLSNNRMALAHTLLHLGHLLLQDDRKDARMEGLEYVSRAADMWTNLIGPQHPLTVATKGIVISVLNSIHLPRTRFGIHMTSSSSSSNTTYQVDTMSRPATASLSETLPSTNCILSTCDRPSTSRSRSLMPRSRPVRSVFTTVREESRELLPLKSNTMGSERSRPAVLTMATPDNDGQIVSYVTLAYAAENYNLPATGGSSSRSDLHTIINVNHINKAKKSSHTKVSSKYSFNDRMELRHHVNKSGRGDVIQNYPALESLAGTLDCKQISAGRDN